MTYIDFNGIEWLSEAVFQYITQTDLFLCFTNLVLLLLKLLPDTPVKGAVDHPSLLICILKIKNMKD